MKLFFPHLLKVHQCLQTPIDFKLSARASINLKPLRPIQNLIIVQANVVVTHKNVMKVIDSQNSFQVKYYLQLGANMAILNNQTSLKITRELGRLSNLLILNLIKNLRGRRCMSNHKYQCCDLYEEEVDVLVSQVNGKESKQWQRVKIVAKRHFQDREFLEFLEGSTVQVG